MVYHVVFVLDRSRVRALTHVRWHTARCGRIVVVIIIIVTDIFIITIIVVHQ